MQPYTQGRKHEPQLSQTGSFSKVLTETLRGWESGCVDTGLCAEQFMQVAGDYEAVVEAVRKLADEK